MGASHAIHRVLGLDCSLSATGVVLLEDGKLMGSTVIRAGERRDAERLTYISGEVMNWAYSQPLGELWEPVDLAAIEGYAYAAPIGQAALGELGGVIRCELYKAGIPYVVIPPASARKIALGGGRLDKRQASLECYKRYGVESASDDVIDAFIVGVAAWLEASGQSKPRPKIRRAA